MRSGRNSLCLEGEKARESQCSIDDHCGEHEGNEESVSILIHTAEKGKGKGKSGLELNSTLRTI